jgi:hypothetical protein
MKRIIGLIVIGALATVTLVAAEVQTSFAEAASAAERQMEGLALRIELVDVMDEWVYVVTSSEGETAYVNADTGRVSSVNGVDEDATQRGRGRGGRFDLGNLLSAVEASLDWEAIVRAAAEKTERDDVRTVAIHPFGGEVAAHVAFGSRFNAESSHLAVIVDASDYTVLDEVTPEFGNRGPGMRGGRGSAGPGPEAPGAAGRRGPAGRTDGPQGRPRW